MTEILKLQHKILLFIDALTGLPYNWRIWRMLYFLYNFYDAFGHVKEANEFIDVELLLDSGKVMLDKNKFDKWIRSRHKASSQTTSYIVKQYYGIDAIKFVEKYI